MWYVAQVSSGQESTTRDMCKQLVDETILQDCFLPEYETMRKVQGEWRSVRRLLFPGYMFVVTDQLPVLIAELKKVPANVRLLGQGSEHQEILPLSESEKDWIIAFTDDSHCVRMSEAYIEGETITVTSGPMLGHEAIIKKVDRHHRRALIEISMFGRSVTATIGLEVVRKEA
jgi:transcriptional antiterminator NusG